MCASNSFGMDAPWHEVNYCFDCWCWDRTWPDLARYKNTVQDLACLRAKENCEYEFSKRGEVPPEGACAECAKVRGLEDTSVGGVEGERPETRSVMVVSMGEATSVASSTSSSVRWTTTAVMFTITPSPKATGDATVLGGATATGKEEARSTSETKLSTSTAVAGGGTAGPAADILGAALMAAAML
ncbi:hypothetical protein OQA88_3468 [Cercophora sp. LCS_1]